MAGCLIIPSSGIPFHLNDQITVRGAAPIYMAGPPSSASGSDIMLVQIRCDLVVLEEMRMPGEDMDIIRADDLFQGRPPQLPDPVPMKKFLGRWW